MGCSFVKTPSYSLVPALYKAKQQQIISYLQLGFGLGNMLGMLEGSIFFDIGGYTLPFFVNAGLIASDIPLVFLYIPSNEEILVYQDEISNVGSED